MTTETEIRQAIETSTRALIDQLRAKGAFEVFTAAHVATIVSALVSAPPRKRGRPPKSASPAPAPKKRRRRAEVRAEGPG